MSGRVVYGRALARTLGFPTANIAIGHHRRALAGVYAVEVEGPLAANRQWPILVLSPPLPKA